MPAYVQISPVLMKHILVLDGWKPRRKDEFNWLLAKNGKYIVIPRKCRTLPFAVFDQILVDAELQGRYLELLEAARLDQQTVRVDPDDVPHAVTSAVICSRC